MNFSQSECFISFNLNFQSVITKTKNIMTTTAGLLGNVSFKDVFDLKAAENIFHKILHVVNKQNQEIQTLKEVVNQIGEKKSQQKELMERECRQLRKRIGHLEDILDLGKENNSLKQVVMENRTNLKRLDRESSSKVSNEQFERSISAMKEVLKDSVRKIRQESLNTGHLKSLEERQDRLHDQMKAMHQSLDCKADQAQLSSIQTAAHKVGRFAIEYEALEASVSKLMEETNELKESFELNATLAMETTIEITKLRTELDHKVNETEYQQDKQVQVSLNEKTKEISRNFSNLQKKIERLTDQQTIWGKQLVKSIKEYNVSFKTYVVQEMEKRVLISKFEHVWEELRRELNCKAWKTDFAALQTQVKQLVVESEQLNRKTTLAVRFIDWFSDRGQAYEHNLNLIETQLGRLIPKSNPRTEPYDETIPLQ